MATDPNPGDDQSNHGNDPNLDSASQQSPDSQDLEELKQQRKNAVTEAIRKHKEAEAAKADATFQKKVNSVLRDPNKLVEIHSEDPELADKISHEVYGKSYDQLIDEYQSKNKDPQVDVRKVVQSELEKERAKDQKAAVESFEEKFFSDNEIIAGSEAYQKIMKIYNMYPHTTVQLASNLLNMAFNTLKEDKPAKPDSKPVPGPSGSSQSSFAPKPNRRGFQPSAAQSEMLMKAGISAEEAQKYGLK